MAHTLIREMDQKVASSVIGLTDLTVKLCAFFNQNAMRFSREGKQKKPSVPSKMKTILCNWIYPIYMTLYNRCENIYFLKDRSISKRKAKV